jgi:hypothetical protein
MSCSHFFSYLYSLFCKNESDEPVINEPTNNGLTINLSLIYDDEFFIQQNENVADIFDLQTFYQEVIIPKESLPPQ